MHSKLAGAISAFVLSETFALQALDGDLVKAIASTGIGGVFALVVLWFYRQREKEIAEQRRQDEEQLKQERKLYQDLLATQAAHYQSTLEKISIDFKETIEANTQAMTMLVTLVKSAPQRASGGR